MTTELELIYTIWDIVRAGQINSDDPINERLMRSFLKIHRGKHLEQYYKKGKQIPDECFQSLGTISFTSIGDVLISNTLPKIIRFEKGRYGIMLDKDGFVISVFNSEEYTNAQFDRYNKFQPRVKFINNKLTLNIGLEQDCNQLLDNHTNSMLNITVRKLKSEKTQNSVTLTGNAVLVNPDNETGYDFTLSPYPLSDELIESLINSVNAREFNLFLRMRSDETGDIRHNIAEQHTREEL
jgi:hypothetical protein